MSIQAKILMAIVIVVILGAVAFFYFTPPAAAPVNEPPEESGQYTLEQVALHASADSCWTVIRGEVYDLTAWVAQHPGGAEAILRLCGTDGTEEFAGQHGGSEKQESALANFKIGILAQ